MEQIKDYTTAVEQHNIVSKADLRGFITFASDEFCELTGYTREELIGKHIDSVNHPDVPQETLELLRETIFQKKAFKSMMKGINKKGEPFYVNLTVAPILDVDGNVAEFITTRYDVTENVLLTYKLKRTEKKLQLLNRGLAKKVAQQTRQLVEINANLQDRINEEVGKNREKDRVMFQQARLASMGEMIGNIAHQWRQPLSELGITLYAIKKSCSKNDMDNVEKEYRHAKHIIDKMSWTIDDFRNFFNPAKKKEEILIADAVKEVFSILEGSFSRMNINTKVSINRNLVFKGYKNEFLQVILNILTNAKDAFYNKDMEEKTVRVKAYEKDNFTHISIADNAGGIKEEILNRIFEPYFTTKQSCGTGLGLYMAKMIIEKSMGGELLAQNINGCANFSIKIPKSNSV